MARFFFFFSSRRRHTRLQGDWSSDVCSSDLIVADVAPDEVGPEIDRQDDVRPHRPTQGHGDRIDDAAVDQVAIVVRDRTKQARHGYGGADRDRHLALAQPDLLSGMQIGRDRRKLYRQLRELALDELLAKDFVDALALDEAAAQAEVCEPEDALPVERERPRLQLVEPARRRSEEHTSELQ